ncbi:hypothetical protein ACX0HA_13655 [Flavobacterium hauense]
MKLKQLIALLLLTVTAASAQTIDVNTTDPQTGTRLILTKNHKGSKIEVDDTVAKTGLVFFSAGYQSNAAKGKTVETYFIDLDMYHNDNKLGCVRQSDNNVLLTLEDGTEIQCFQISETDCSHEAYKASFALTSKKGTFEDMEKNFKKLQTVAIAKIVVTTTEGALVYKIKHKDYVKAHFALVAKTLNSSVK